LREPIKHLSRASYIFLTKSDGSPDEALLELIRENNPKAEIIECAHKPQYLQSVDTGERLPLDVLRGAQIGAFSGIASPESFEKMLQDFGAEIRYNQRFLDHHRFTRYEIERLYRKADNADLDMIVTTEKDAVRLFDDIKASVPVYYLRLEIEILSGEEDFESATERICRPRTQEPAISPAPWGETPNGA
jgi:tetraacyldisaccharide 4'-kinase